MPSLTLKNLPEDLYRALRERASTNRRSINGEAQVCLEQALGIQRDSLDATLARLEKLRNELPLTPLTDEMLRKARDDGRP